MWEGEGRQELLPLRKTGRQEEPLAARLSPSCLPAFLSGQFPSDLSDILLGWEDGDVLDGQAALARSSSQFSLTASST